MITFFTDIFSYHHKYNQEVIRKLWNHREEVDDQTLHWMQHILESHFIWLQRIEKKDDMDVEWNEMVQWAQLDIKNYDRSINIIIQQPLDRPIRYINRQKESYVNTVADILYHISNHTAHHKGMIISQLRGLGIEPPVTDYIFYKRQ